MSPIEFDLESKLLKVLETQARSTNSPFARSGAELMVVPQVSVGQTIPDLVIVRTLHGAGPSSKVTLTGFESWIVGELMRTGALREATLTRKLFTRTESTLAALAKLERVGLVRRTETGTYVLTSDFSARFEVVSVEGKLTRWQGAIEQAKSYFRFSDESFIALPASVVERNHRIFDRCVAEGVGLIAVGRKEVRVILSPRRRADPDRRQWTWLLAKTGALQA
jgi:hypothetical protein